MLGRRILYITKIIQPTKLKLLSIMLPLRVLVLNSKEKTKKILAHIPINSSKTGFI